MPASKGRWWLTCDSQQIVINASPERIYDLVSDLPRMGEWSPECEQVEWTDGSTPPRWGARFIGHNRGGPFRLMRWSRRGRVLAAARGREFAFVTEEGGRESTVWRLPLRARRGRHPGHRVLPGPLDPDLGPDHRRPDQPAPRAAGGHEPHAQAAPRRRRSAGLGARPAWYCRGRRQAAPTPAVRAAARVARRQSAR